MNNIKKRRNLLNLINDNLITIIICSHHIPQPLRMSHQAQTYIILKQINDIRICQVILEPRSLSSTTRTKQEKTLVPASKNSIYFIHLALILPNLSTNRNNKITSVP